ncbi:MAG: alpha/beta hydrolase [archaeon]|nr:alpha/beta hydrolase [archaeon]
MGFLGNMFSTLGLDHKERIEKERTVSGVRSMSSLAYLGDAHGGHFMDIMWSKEALNPIPLVFFFNGTVFNHTNKGRASNLCRLIAKRDFIVVNCEFRDLSKTVSVRDEIDDLLAMMDWVTRNRDRFNIDLQNVYVVGSSYGALMALWMTNLCTGKRMHNALGIERPGIRIKGLGLFTGMTDTESGDSDMRPVAASIEKLRKTDKDLAECLLPWENHDLFEMPPVFQVTSDNDSALPDVIKLQKLLDTNNVPNETMTFGATTHTMRGFMEMHSTTNECSRVLSRMLTFFKENEDQ